MDIFCEAGEKLKNQIIHQTEHFILLHDGYPLAEGHLILIPKKHRDCFMNLTPEEKTEYTELKGLITRFLTDSYREPVMFEHGAVAQTIPHAHMHFLPVGTGIRRQIESVATPMERAAIPYLYYADLQGETYYRVTKDIIPGFLHTTFAQVLGRPVHGPDRAPEAALWILQVKQFWKRWLAAK